MDPVSVYTLPGRTIQVREKDWLYFSGTSYLGMSHHSGFRDLLLEGLLKYGTHFGGSRRSNVHIRLFETVEQYLAQLTGFEQALLFSSGTLAGQVLLKVLKNEAELVLAPGVHPALWDMEGPGTSPSWDSWASEVATRIQTEGPTLAILSNSLDPLRVQRMDLQFLQHLTPQRRVLLVVDDSHGFGVLGTNGIGCLPEFLSFKSFEILGVSSLGKACGIPAGAVFGPPYWIEKIWQSPFMGGASPASPAFLYAFLHGAPFYSTQRAILQRNLAHFQNALQQRIEHFQYISGFPAFFSIEPDLAAHLEAHEIFLSSFRYPTPMDPLYNRIVISSLHQPPDIDHLVHTLDTFFLNQLPNN